MKFTKAILAASLALGLSGTIARAEDWTGFYLGVLGGGSFVGEWGECVFCIGSPGVAKVAGYNWDDGDIIYGLEEMVIFTTYTDAFKISWQAAGRVGTHIGEDAMIYGAGGVGVSHVPAGPFTVAYGHVGGGIESALTEDLLLRAHTQLSFPFNSEWWDAGITPVVSIGTGLVWQLN